MPDHSAYQKGVIKRYYEHRDTIAVQRLAETVSDLYLARSKAKLTSLWENVYKQLQAAGVPLNKACVIVEERDLGELAKVVNELS